MTIERCLGFEAQQADLSGCMEVDLLNGINSVKDGGLST
jgi:hypothetical protein